MKTSRARVITSMWSAAAAHLSVLLPLRAAASRASVSSKLASTAARSVLQAAVGVCAPAACANVPEAQHCQRHPLHSHFRVPSRTTAVRPATPARLRGQKAATIWLRPS